MGRSESSHRRSVAVMNLPIVFLRAAECEYDEAARWYESRQPGVGLKFTEAVETILQKIATAPERYPLVANDVREAIVQRFPFSIFFALRSNRVVVLSVFHQARDPQVWRARID